MAERTVKSNADSNALAEALERILRVQLDGHQRLLQCIERKREAIRTADISSIADICGEENTLIQRLAELEKHRLELIGRLTSAMNPHAQKPLTISEIAQNVSEPRQSALLAIAAQLRDALSEAKRQSSIVRSAAESLSRHMSGIVQTVHGALSRARVYGHRGKIKIGAQLQSSLDLKS